MSTYKRSYPKKTYRKKRYVKKSTSDRHVKAIVRKELKKEVPSKWYDRNFTQTVDGIALTVSSPTTGLVRGDGENNYEGTAIKPTYFIMRGQLFKSTDVNEHFNQFRMLILQDKGATVTPTLNNLFQDITTPWFSPLNKDSSQNWNVLYDRNWCLRRIDGIDAPYNVKVKIPGSRLKKMDFTNAAGNLQSGGMWICCFSDSAVASHPTTRFQTRLTYKNM